MRVQGSICLRGKTYWIRYSWHGKEYRESAKTGDEKKAQRTLQQRLKAVGTPYLSSPKGNATRLTICWRRSNCTI
jgi:hypothetical protein